jgi:hypothetical protein
MTWKEIKTAIRYIKEADTVEQLHQRKLNLALQFVTAIADGHEMHCDKARLVKEAIE